MKKNQIENQVKELVEELLTLLQITAEIEVTPNIQGEGDEPSVNVVINSDKEAGLLIGAHGSTLSAIQSFITLAMRQKTGDWIRVSVDVGEWRIKHEEYLVDLAKQAADRARTTGEPQHLYNLTPAQRRVIHVALGKEKGILTESQGEGEGRYLIVKPE